MRGARIALLGAVALLTALTAPAGVRAAGSLAVTGTVVRDGAPVTGVEVVVSVTGGDTAASATTDENGAFAVDVEAGVGSAIQVFATGRTSRTEPDAKGCVRSETPVGSLAAVIDADPPTPLVVPLDRVLTDTACSAIPTPRVTPPATDGLAGPGPGGTTGSLLVVLGVLALVGGGSLALARRRG